MVDVRFARRDSTRSTSRSIRRLTSADTLRPSRAARRLSAARSSGATRSVIIAEPGMDSPLVRGVGDDNERMTIVESAADSVAGPAALRGRQDALANRPPEVEVVAP